MRARIDVSEIEATTKIRAKYLRALENEEWSLLPGPTFVKSFLRTYAQALGLDGKSLVEEYRLHHESPSDAMLEPLVSTPQRRRTTPSNGPSRGYVAAVGTIVVVIVVLIVLLISGGGSPKKAGTSTIAKRGRTPAGTHHTHKGTTGGAGALAPIISLSLHPTAAVYVCLIGDGGRRLISGINLQAGEDTPIYHARHFVITLGNSSVAMYLDGTPRTVAPSSQAIGYSITKARGRQPLPSSQLPTCK